MSIIDGSVFQFFLVGLFGGLHCAGMCGGIVTAVGIRARETQLISVPTHASEPAYSASLAGIPVATESPHSGIWSSCSFYKPAWSLIFAYNSGRILTYVLLGFVAGSMGSISWWVQHTLPVQQIAFVATNLLLLFAGLYICGVGRVANRIESLGAPVWKRLKPVATRALTRQGLRHAVATGGLWGLVPCGLVYTAILAALLSGSGTAGAALMLAFGLGTLPNMLALSLAATGLSALTRYSFLRTLAGGTLIVFALLGLLRTDAARSIPWLNELCLTLL